MCDKGEREENGAECFLRGGNIAKREREKERNPTDVAIVVAVSSS